MALTFNQALRERRKVILKLKQELKIADSQLEKIERKIKQVYSRKRKLPEINDLDQMGQELNALVNALDKFARTLDRGFIE